MWHQVVKSCRRYIIFAGQRSKIKPVTSFAAPNAKPDIAKNAQGKLIWRVPSFAPAASKRPVRYIFAASGAGDTRGGGQGRHLNLLRLVFASAAPWLAAESCSRWRSWHQVASRRLLLSKRQGRLFLCKIWIIYLTFLPDHRLRPPRCTSPPFAPTVLLQDSLGMRRSPTRRTEDHV